MNNGPANSIATWIKNANPEKTASIEVMEYALSIVINTVLIVSISLIIGFISDELIETAITLFSFALLRFFSGGMHLKSSFGCIATSILVCSIIPHLPELSANWIFVVTFVSILLLLFFAPHIDRETEIKKSFRPFLKWLSVVIVCSNFILCSSILAVIFLVQSLTVIPEARR